MSDSRSGRVTEIFIRAAELTLWVEANLVAPLVLQRRLAEAEVLAREVLAAQT